MAIKFLNTVQVDTDVLYVDTANDRVGIGTDSPSKALHVRDANDAPFRVESTDATTGIQFKDSDSDNAFYYVGSGDYFYTSASAGIGTTSVSSANKLQVNGQLRVVGSQIIGNSNVANVAPTGVQLHLKNSGEAALRLEDSDSTNLAFDISVNEGSGFSIIETVGGDAGNDTRLFIEETTGSIGIATTTPSSSHKLDVNGAGRFSGNVTSTGNISARSFDMNSTYESSNQYLQLHKNQANDGGILLRSKTAAGAGQVDWQIVNQGTTGDLKFYAYGLGGNAFVLDRETGNLQLPEYGAGTLVSDASGNISVSSGGGAGGPYLPLSAGLSYPLTDTLYGTKATFGDTNIDVATVTIEGGLAGILDIWRNGTNASYQAIRFRDDTNANTEASIGWASNQLRLNGTSTIVATIGGSEKMRIDSVGNVGIGVTSLAAKLNVVAGTGSPTVLLGRAAGQASIKADTDSSGHLIIDSSTGHVYINNYVNKNIYLANGGGKVGIGTTSPSNKLSLAGSGQNWSTSPAIKMWDSYNSKGWYVGSANNATIGDFYIRSVETEGAYPVAANQQFTIKQSGNVGIGTISPENKLHVQQSGLFTGIQNTAGIRIKSDGGSAIGNYHGTLALSRGTGSVAISAVQEAADSDVMGMAFFTHPSTTGGAAAVEQMRIDSDGNVGIGTDNPGVKLHLNSSAELTATYQKFTNGTATTGTNLGIDSDGDFIINNGEAKEIKLYTSDSQRVTIQSGGNVGIGTTAPTHLLSVKDSVNNADVGISIQNSFDDNLATSNPNAVVFLNAASNNGYLRVHGAPANTASKHQIDLGSTAGSSFLTFSPNGAERMRIDSAGDVGIGTTNPLAKLEVMSSSQTLSTAKFDSIELQTYTVNNSWVGENLYYDGSFKYRADGYATALYFDGSGFDIRTAPSGTAGNVATLTTAFTLLESSGNVGIGTTAPGVKLDVNGDIRGYGSVKVNSAADGDPYLALYQNGTEKAYFQYVDSGDNLVLQSDGIFTFKTATAERVRITAGGRVGIGVTNPSAKLQVEDSANNIQMRVGSLTTGRSPIIRLQGRNSANTTNYYADIELDADDGKLIFNDPGTSGSSIGQNPMVLDSSGNVGIGTTSPDAKLDIHYFTSGGNDDLLNIGLDATNPTRAKIYTENYDGNFGLWNSGSTQQVKVSSDGDSYFNGGNVGIGTTSPGYKLDVSGDARFTSDITVGNTAGSQINMLRTSANYINATNNTGYLVFRTGGYDTALTLNASQNATFAGDLTVSGGDITLGGTGRIQGVDTVSASTDAANKAYVDAQGTNFLQNEGAFISGDTLLEILETDTTEDVRVKLNKSTTTTIERVDDPTAPAGGCFQLNNAYVSFTLPQYHKIDDDQEYTFELWGKFISGTDTNQSNYLGSSFYGSTKNYLGNSQRYWGESGFAIDSNTNNDGWYFMSGTLGPARGANTSQIPTAAHWMKLIMLLNYNTQANTVRYCGLKVYKSGHKGAKKVTSIYRKSLGSQASSSADQWIGEVVMDTAGALHAPNITLADGIYHKGDTNTYINFLTDTIQMSTAGSPRVYINSGGDVGIGTTNPQDKLEVLGNIRLSPSVSNAETVYISTNSRGTGTNDADLRLGNSNSGDVLTVHNTNVGIGTTSPGANLEVAGNTLLDGRVYINATTSIPNRAEEFQVTGRQIITNTGTDGPSLDLGYNSSGSVRLQLGRGRTADGLAYMDFNGEVMPAGSYGFRIIRNSGANAVTQLNQVGTGNLQINASNGADTVFTNTNVGIGNTNPGYKLDVSGNARFTGQTTHSAGLLTSSTQTRNKISVWSSLSSYTIGMKSGFGYGGLGGDSTGTDYAMSFQMSNTTNRGWWWGDTSHTDLQGAMSLTTQGKLVVAKSIKVGAGESTRSAGTSQLTVVAPLSSSGTGTDFQIDGGSGFGMKNVQIEIPAYGDGLRFTSFAASSVDNNAVTFYQDTTKRGSIIVNATSTSYNTTSDYRLKENKEDISDAIERVKLLNPVKFNWISEPNKPKVDGFYAHELAEVVPEAVSGEKDALDYENKPEYQSIDQSKIVPLLAAALQQAIDKIEILEQKIQLIENK